MVDHALILDTTIEASEGIERGLHRFAHREFAIGVVWAGEIERHLGSYLSERFKRHAGRFRDFAKQPIAAFTLQRQGDRRLRIFDALGKLLLCLRAARQVIGER